MTGRRRIYLLATFLSLFGYVEAAGAVEVRSCNARRAGTRQVDVGGGKTAPMMMFRVRLQRGTSCKFPMETFDSVTFEELRVVKSPTAGRLLSASRNRVVYQAGAKGEGDAFALFIRITGMRGSGAALVGTEVRYD